VRYSVLGRGQGTHAGIFSLSPAPDLDLAALHCLSVRNALLRASAAPFGPPLPPFCARLRGLADPQGCSSSESQGGKRTPGQTEGEERPTTRGTQNRMDRLGSVLLFHAPLICYTSGESNVPDGPIGFRNRGLHHGASEWPARTGDFHVVPHILRIRETANL
jgi:hypothetical protein